MVVAVVAVDGAVVEGVAVDDVAWEKRIHKPRLPFSEISCPLTAKKRRKRRRGDVEWALRRERDCRRRKSPADGN